MPRIKDQINQSAIIVFHTCDSIQWTPKPTFGYRIKSNYFQITGKYIFPNREAAQFSAAEWAFQILE